MSQSPLILAVDTSTELGSVALRRAHETLADVHLQATDGFGHIIFGAIEQALAQARSKLNEVDCFAAASGPGSFTGVRVALATVKGLAEALGKPALGISNLRALSLAGHATLRAVALDARRGDVYGALYDSQAKIVTAETVAPLQGWLASLPTEAELIGLNSGPCRNAERPFTAASPWLAAWIAECAEMDGPSGWLDPVGLDANYVRRSDAELSWREA